MIYQLGNRVPEIALDVFIAESADIIGSVRIDSKSSIWFGAVLRGDNEQISLGERTNIQDNVVVHADKGVPTIMGNDVSIGHNSVIHGCNIGSGSLIGIGSTILNNAEIGVNSLVGAMSLVTENKKFPPRSLIMGTPARLVRELNELEIERLGNVVKIYVDKVALMSSKLKKISED